ncbi:hypothetical protein [Microcoleus sp. B4-D4]|uniref:hypothetical protein n=1 Tax=Microcoleus sp. B4-D4 TaxID=2818667 RepID=UPI002FCFE2CC
MIYRHCDSPLNAVKKKEEGRRKKEEGRRKKEEGRRKKYTGTFFLASRILHLTRWI